MNLSKYDINPPEKGMKLPKEGVKFPEKGPIISKEEIQATYA